MGPSQDSRGSLRPGTGALRYSLSRALGKNPARWLLLCCLLGGLPAAAQPTNSSGQSNALNSASSGSDAEALVSNLMVQAGEFAPTNEPALTNETEPQTNFAVRPVTVLPSSGRSPAQTSSPGSSAGRMTEEDTQRSSSSRRSPIQESVGDSGGRPQPTRATPAAAARPDYSNFRVIAERNIFDPNRYAHRPNEPRSKPRAIEAFGLVGVMSYDKGTFAFFDGTGSAYKKVLKRNDTIAGYKLARIEPDAVELASGTNAVQLRVGMQLRRADEGPWTTSTQSDSFEANTSNVANTANSSNASSSASNSPSPAAAPATAAASGNESDVLKRLMQRREQE